MTIVEAAEVRQRLTMPVCIDLMRTSLRELEAGNYTQPLRSIALLPGGEKFGFMPRHRAGKSLSVISRSISRSVSKIVSAISQHRLYQLLRTDIGTGHTQRTGRKIIIILLRGLSGLHRGDEEGGHGPEIWGRGHYGPE